MQTPLVSRSRERVGCATILLVEEYIKLERTKKKLGEMLIEEGFLSDDQLSDAIKNIRSPI